MTISGTILAIWSAEHADRDGGVVQIKALAPNPVPVVELERASQMSENAAEEGNAANRP